jgi:RES domain-containing protein
MPIITLYRIVQTLARVNDLTGIGAYKFGGRWNSKGTYMLYTSQSSSLAYLENLVHFDPLVFPSQLFIMTIEVKEGATIRAVKDDEYPDNWIEPDLLENKLLGDSWMKDEINLGVLVRSSVNPQEYNCLLNPLFPDFKNLVKVVDVKEIGTDKRLRSK